MNLREGGGSPERPSPTRPALARLIDIPDDLFESDYWGARPLLTRAHGTFDDLFSAAAVDELVAERGLRTPFVRMAHEGSVLPPARFTSSGGYGAEIGDQIDSAKVLREFAGGASLVLQGLHRTWHPLAEFTRRLVADLGHPAQVNAYITPASSRGFDPHYDTHDVFVIQIAGAKHWTIHEPVYEHPLADQPWSEHRDAVAARARQSPTIDATFEPGDVLYLPRGWIHSAVAQGGTSIHLTIGVRAATRFDVLQQLVAEAADDPELRRPLGLGGSLGLGGLGPGLGENVAREVDATIAATRALLERADAAAVGRALQRSFEGATRPAPVRPLATADLLADLAPDTLVGWRPGLPAHVRDDDRGVSIALRARTITLPAEASAAVHALTVSDLPAGALPGLDEASAVVVSRRLLREGVLVAR